MEAELAALAASGATALVGLMVSEAYERTKSGLTRFFGRRASEGAAEEELQAARDELGRATAAGDAGARAEVQTRLRQRLEGMFQADPGAAQELSRLLSELAPEASRTFVNLVSGGVNHGPVFQGSPIHGDIHFHVPPAPSYTSDRPVRPDQVPVVTVPFSNRTAELADLDARLGTRAGGAGSVGVDVLVGLPGVGKSAMAWRCAERVKGRFPDGQLYVDFAALRDQVTPLTGPGGDVSEALAMCLRSLPGGDLGIPDSLLDRTNLFRSRTANLRILLVLDDVNQAAQVRALIPKGPGSAVLVTSQGRIGELAAQDGARLTPVKPLDAHGGLELLRDRCGEEAVEAEREAAQRLVELCGGLPVALQVVAARLATDDGLSMTELAAELDDEAGRLAGLALDGEESSVSAVLGPSYRLLPPDEARLYRLLGWLPFGLFDAGVAAVAGDVDTTSAQRLLRVLAKASLVEAAGDGRYRMHDLVRLHARERAAEEEPETEQAALTDRVGTHYLVLTAFADRALRKERLRIADLAGLLREADDPFAAVGGPPPLEWLDTERPAVLAVLRTAVRHELYTLAWRLAEAFSVLFLYRRYLRAWTEALELGIEAAAQAAASADTAGEIEEATAGEARLRSLLSRPLLDLGDTGRAGEQVERSVALAEATDRLDLRASVQEFLGRYLEVVEPPRAVEAYRRSLELNERAGETRGAALATFFLGCALDARGDHADALALLRRALRDLESRQEPDRRMAARVKAAIGVVHGHLGDTGHAIRDLREAVRELAGVADGMQYEAQARVRLADVAQRTDGGHEELARECLSRAADIYHALGNLRLEEELRQRLNDLDR
ncbi:MULTISPECIES: NB-ARC domain-containing protein [unclassified Streptomyces]|uniref:NB-ARC domain-containing protein n=1 Tax=unclassified Streptomyces TaxID=2593676 RepID=UPI002366157E|nr:MULTISPECIES: NB-ARC domain-containing protein [unclassified Streptomyces]MDF3146597.1 NB-ARC domain-containing protein [Streptomyces sp. T21Q-yed]WDF43727.1 NB-ARC domain-containing protein [Streptomyces sp. T12]